MLIIQSFVFRFVFFAHKITTASFTICNATISAASTSTATSPKTTKTTMMKRSWCLIRSERGWHPAKESLIWFCTLVQNCLKTNYTGCFPATDLKEKQHYSEIEKYRNKMKLNLCTVFIPVLCSKAENLLNKQLWLQTYDEFLPEMREQKCYVFSRCVNFSCWLKLWSLLLLWLLLSSFCHNHFKCVLASP